MPQSLTKLYVHLAFSTKHREPLLLAPLRAQMHAYLATVLKRVATVSAFLTVGFCR